MKYEDLESKYQLPNKEEFITDFGTPDFHDEDDHPLVELRRKIIDKIDYFANLLGELLQPESNLIGFYEYKYLEDDNREKLFKAFKILMSYGRLSSALSTYYIEEEEIKFVNDFYNDWQQIKETIKTELIIFSENWKDEKLADKINENYMG